MASTSAVAPDGRIRNAAATLYSDNQSIIAEIRKSLSVMKGIAVDLEKDKQSQMVKELEDGVIELLKKSHDCTNFSLAIETVGNSYQLKDEATDFKKLFKEEVAKINASSPLVPQDHPFLRQFKEAIWHVHHAGQPMPGEEQEDMVMTSTQSSLLNIVCPMTGKSVFELTAPVRSMDCKHIYEKEAVMPYIRSKNNQARCPQTGCPKILQAGRVVCDPLLPIEIDEMRSMANQTEQLNVIEDFTEQEED